MFEGVGVNVGAMLRKGVLLRVLGLRSFVAWGFGRCRGYWWEMS